MIDLNGLAKESHEISKKRGLPYSAMNNEQNLKHAARLLEQQFGEDIPAEARKMGAGQIKYAAKKTMGADVERVLCNGMSVKVKGHVYTITCVNNATENALRDFINERKL